MKTHFTAEQLSQPRIAQANRVLGDCVHYGFCVSACPTYVLTGDENESPRGRIDLIHSMLEKGGAPDARTVRHIDTCLSCLSCMSTCAARVDYMHLVDIAREHIETHFRRPWRDRLARRLVASLLPYPRRLRSVLRLARAARTLAPLLPRRLRAMLALAPRTPPAASMPRRAVHPAEGARRARVALLPGCVQQVIATHINAAAIRILQRQGCEVVTLDTGCCGALALHMGKEREAHVSAESAVSALARERHEHGLDAVLVTASGCGTTIKDYARLFPNGSPLAGDAASLAGITLDISEYLARTGPLEPRLRTGLKVAYHDPCSLQHGQKVTIQPRKLLRQAGFELVEIPEKHFCCGSAGTYNILQPDTALELGRRKASNIRSTGAHVVATGNLGCIAQLRQYLELPIVHTVELLDWAAGGPLPAALAGLDIPPPADETKDAPPDLPAATSGPSNQEALW